MKKYIPVIPGGMLCTWLAADTEEEAWANLLRDPEMPYKGKAEAQERGCKIFEAQLPDGEMP